MNQPTPTVLCRCCFGAREVMSPAAEFKFMNRVFVSSPKLRACPECSVTEVSAVRTHNSTGLIQIVRTGVECQFRDEQPTVTLTNGVTGWESVYADERFIMETSALGWLACAGTPKRYDRLFIPAREMKRAFSRLGLDG